MFCLSACLTNHFNIVKINDIMGRLQTSNLTPAHSRILQVIINLMAEGRPITVGELVSELDLAGQTSLVPTLKIMQRNGFIEMHGGGERGRRHIISLATKGKAVAGLGGLPVLGSIPAGPLSEVLEQCDTTIEGRALLSYQAGDFLLIVHGDSMIGDGILPGDRVLLRPGVQAQHGEIAAVHVGDDYLATLKHICIGPSQNQITLKASNPCYDDIVVAAKDLRVAGVYRGLVREGRSDNSVAN